MLQDSWDYIPFETRPVLTRIGGRCDVSWWVMFFNSETWLKIEAAVFSIYLADAFQCWTVWDFAFTLCFAVHRMCGLGFSFGCQTIFETNNFLACHERQRNYGICRVFWSFTRCPGRSSSDFGLWNGAFSGPHHGDPVLVSTDVEWFLVIELANRFCFEFVNKFNFGSPIFFLWNRHPFLCVQV